MREHQVGTLEVMSFFDGTNREQYNQLVEWTQSVELYSCCPRMANESQWGVTDARRSIARHVEGLSKHMRSRQITNAQNHTYWKDAQFREGLQQTPVRR